jgi:26S proteasome regulatory subunit T6
MAIETKHPEAVPADETCSAKASKQGEGLKQYYLQHIHEHQLQVRQKTHNLNRLEAQRNEFNSRGILFYFT